MSTKDVTDFQKNLIGWISLVIVIVGMWVTTQKDITRIETEQKFQKEINEKQDTKIQFNDEKTQKKLDKILEAVQKIEIEQAKNN